MTVLLLSNITGQEVFTALWPSKDRKYCNTCVVPESQISRQKNYQNLFRVTIIHVIKGRKRLCNRAILPVFQVPRSDDTLLQSLTNKMCCSHHGTKSMPVISVKSSQSSRFQQLCRDLCHQTVRKIPVITIRIIPVHPGVAASKSVDYQKCILISKFRVIAVTNITRSQPAMRV